MFHGSQNLFPNCPLITSELTLSGAPLEHLLPLHRTVYGWLCPPVLPVSVCFTSDQMEDLIPSSVYTKKQLTQSICVYVCRKCSQICYIVGMGQNNHWNHFILSDRPQSSRSSSLAPLPRCFPVHPWLWVTGAFPLFSPHFYQEQNSPHFFIQSRNDIPSVVFTLCSQDLPSVLYVEKRQFLTPMFIAAPFTMPKRQKQSKWSWTDEWINNMWYI